MRDTIKKMRTLRFAAILLIFSATAMLASSCQWYVQGEIDKNTANLAKLRVGMSKDEVRQIMGDPDPKEAYNTDKVWFYYTRTRWQDGAATTDECTPVVFDEDSRLAGWGDQYYKANCEFTTWPSMNKSKAK